MYYYVIGTVKSINNNIIVIENHDIGYEIYFCNPYIFRLNQKIKLFTYYHIQENIRSLYGFVDIESLLFFKKLIALPGIGPKSAIVMTNPEFCSQVQKAIQDNDISFLIQFPGIGNKTAQQILFSLKDNLFITDKNKLTCKQKDVKEALLNLGFKKHTIEMILYKLDSNQSLELMIKEALSLLNLKK
ncbi:MAG: Holliday junction branch migration protein RuvA [Weeping tea tree witches'-broom phytoplasma]|uniref:Holliday junction branch migration protein RuvA n=1 Tax=Candidatus Phytoplasma melaleucae TaxID=2982630 RepID=UPI00293A6B44|nr:Holliday junction branch migration protein RuvA [Weeping tea tree witches'-broom phytoplasma]